MVTMPALVLLGLSPQSAIATDMFALFGGRIGGLVALLRAGKVEVGLGLRLSVLTAIGGLAGAYALLAVPAALMERLIAVFLVVLSLALLLMPSVGVGGKKPEQVSVQRQCVGAAGFLGVGFVGTFVGAGFLSIGSALLLFVFRKSFLQAAGLLTIVGMATASSALLVLGSHGTIVWPIGLSMMAGKAFGGYLGARTAVKLGEGRIRLLFIAVVALSATRLVTCD